MTPAGLKSYRILRTLGLPDAIIRKVGISADGRPSFTALTDNEFDELKRSLRRKYPWASSQPYQNTPNSTQDLTPDLHGTGVSGATH